LALTFGTLLSSQGTVASFVLTLSGFPPGFPSVLRFRLYQIFPIRFPRCFPGFSLSRFPFPAVPTLSDPFGPDSLSAGPFDIHYVRRFLRQLIIELRRFELGHAGTPKFDPVEGVSSVVVLPLPTVGERRTRFSGSGYITQPATARQLERRLGV
ncbi:hypothetical protein ACIQKE_04990, partial [Streptomyces griseoviridis]